MGPDSPDTPSSYHHDEHHPRCRFEGGGIHTGAQTTTAGLAEVGLPLIVLSRTNRSADGVVGERTGRGVAFAIL